MRYEKGRKDASRGRIMEVAAERFRSDGIAASGLATIMSDAGLTNGAFYPHFQSKAELVREAVAAALEAQTEQIREALLAGGPDLAIAIYLSPEHRDNPAKGCASAALLPEIARQPPETRSLYAERLQAQLDLVAAALPESGDREGTVLGLFATLIGTLQLARAAQGSELSDRILAAGMAAARTLIRPERERM